MYDVYGTLCGTYEEACIAAGIETPDQLEAEARYEAMMDEIGDLRSPVGSWLCQRYGHVRQAQRDFWLGFADEMPF